MVKEDKKNDVSLNSRYLRHPENCGSTDFERRFEETKTVLNAPAHSAAIIRQFRVQKQVATLNQPPILARFVSPRLLPVPEGEVAAEGCKI